MLTFHAHTVMLKCASTAAQEANIRTISPLKHLKLIAVSKKRWMGILPRKTFKFICSFTEG